MTLADTSVWIEHFRQGNELGALLEEGRVLLHPFVIGELACGNLRSRKRILDDLAALPAAVAATDDEVFSLIEKQRLWGRGIGWIDAHLLAAAILSGCALWTLDRALASAARSIGVPELR
jgi:predicted nucleic acid-binding protein